MEEGVEVGVHKRVHIGIFVRTPANKERAEIANPKIVGARGGEYSVKAASKP